MQKDLNYMLQYNKGEKWLIVGDVHWSEYSSIYRKRGIKFSKRLESLINTLNWIEETAEQNHCTRIIFLGDTFDRNDLNANEITALQEVIWSHIPHVFLVGNHEGLMNDLSTSSAHLLKLIPNVEVIDQPTLDYGFGYSVLYLPYILESERKPLTEYYRQCESDGYFITQEVKKRIVFSHNDLKMQYGMFDSKIGFDLEEVGRSDFFVNGHIHNFMEVTPKIINLGNICGANFSENAKHYPHHIMIFDPESCDYAYQENPFALHFYKFDIMSISELNKELLNINDNAIMSIKAPQSLVAEVKQILDHNNKVKEYRVITLPELISTENGKEGPNTDVIESVNHLDEFIKFVKENIDYTEIVQIELAEVCK